jgi:O-antigen biosynthesis protein WbqP
VKRVLDIVLVVLTLPVVLPICALVAVLVRLTSPGSALYWSERVGRNNVNFMMPKFRSMRLGTPALATHELSATGQVTSYLTPIGAMLRKTSLDELPQLWSVLIGHMTLVGPRPALFNQADLIAARTDAGVHVLAPGITGWAQINGRDEIPIPQKVELDAYYLRHQSSPLDIRILCLTVFKVLGQKGVSH